QCRARHSYVEQGGERPCLSKDGAASLGAGFDDPAYKAMQFSGPAEMQRLIDKQIDDAAAAVARLRARGVKVAFVRLPTAGRYLE
ncbi:MAG TPA: hypothetical protein VH207_11785, partial [Chthoniobacterales bacterium]|nr:hypothetical protein [Chthoniobacterales bacterium]